MRIIAGDYKGRKIFEPLDKETRPLKNLTKESVFNILEHSKNARISIKKSNVLDLFSGIGSFGLECISRGAAKVYFIEQRKPSIKILAKNIKKLNCEKKVKLFSKNVFFIFVANFSVEICICSTSNSLKFNAIAIQTDLWCQNCAGQLAAFVPEDIYLTKNQDL